MVSRIRETGGPGRATYRRRAGTDLPSVVLATPFDHPADDQAQDDDADDDPEDPGVAPGSDEAGAVVGDRQVVVARGTAEGGLVGVGHRAERPPVLEDLADQPEDEDVREGEHSSAGPVELAVRVVGHGDSPRWSRWAFMYVRNCLLWKRQTADAALNVNCMTLRAASELYLLASPDYQSSQNASVFA